MRARGLVVLLLPVHLLSIVERLDAQSFAYVADATGSSISAYAVDPSSGALSQIPGSPFADPACGGQQGSCPVWVAADPSQKFLYVAEAQAESISVFSIIPSTGVLTPVSGGTISVGEVIQSITVHPTGRFAYAASASSGNIFIFAIDPVGGKLSPIPGSPFPATPGVPIYTLNFDPSGRFLYAGTNNDQLFAATVDMVTGGLTPIQGSPFVGGMRAAITPNGTFLYTGGENTQGTGYQINSSTGGLTPLSGSGFSVSRGAIVEPDRTILIHQPRSFERCLWL